MNVQVALEGKTDDATVLRMDERRDLAVLQIKAKRLTALPLANSGTVEVGEEVWAVGFPLASVLGDSVKVTRGRISGFGTKNGQKFFQIDAAVNPGNRRSADWRPRDASAQFGSRGKSPSVS